LTPIDIHWILLALVLSAVFAWVAYLLRFLNASGSVAAAVLGTVILGTQGWTWVLPLLAFFVSSSLLSKLRAMVRGEFEEARGASRDAVQVLANGSAAGIMALADAVLGVNLYPGYLGALAAAAGDTWSTEIGLIWGRRPRRITNFEPVPAGTSGGITLPGLLGALLGAFLIAMTGFFAAVETVASSIIILITAAGFSGSVVDSLLGATVQGRLRCQVCGRLTERKTHCAAATRSVGGCKWLNNDGVNAAATTFGALLSLALIYG